MMINKFLAQNEYYDAFITGPAGSGKTTLLKEIVESIDVNFIVTAYTHKAKDVLIEKLPKGTRITTLHSFLKKRPGINRKAKNIKQLQISTRQGKPEQLDLIIVDEFSFIGEADALDLQALQDPIELELYRCKGCGYEFTELYNDHKCDRCGSGDYIDISLNPVKILYVGDLNQLSPIKGPSYIEPYGPYWMKLTTVHRNSFPQLQDLVKFIEGTESPRYLEPDENFIRGVDIDKLYSQSEETSKIMLAYTNKAVQEHNAAIMGRQLPQPGDEIYIASLKTKATVIDIVSTYTGEVVTPSGYITPTTKYNPLGYLNKHKKVKFYITNIGVIAGIFGSYTNKIVREEIAKKLVEKNKKGQDSAKEYREYKTLNDYVCNIDFSYCMTVHKSQGSEFNEVYIDILSFKHCIDKQERLKLLYVAMSRAIKKIFLNF